MRGKNIKTMWLFIVVAGVLGAYIIACVSAFLIPMLKMGKIDSYASDKESGQVRYTEASKNPEFVINLGDEDIFYFPSENGENKPFVLVCPGGGYVDCALETEGYPIANRINELGYTAFVLKYRVGKNSTENTPLDGLAKAIEFLLDNKEKYNITDDYALCGFSAGGNLIGLFGSSKCGYCAYNIKKPTALIMGYPWLNTTNENNGNLAFCIYYATLNKGGYMGFLGKNYTQEDKEFMNVLNQVDQDYTPSYFMHGDIDKVVPADSSSGKLSELLDKYNVPYVYKMCSGVPHGIGLGIGTSAEGWLDEGIAFWQSQIGGNTAHLSCFS